MVTCQSIRLTLSRSGEWLLLVRKCLRLWHWLNEDQSDRRRATARTYPRNRKARTVHSSGFNKT
jgi:hypothetical protein